MSGRLVECEHRGRYRWASELAAGHDVLDAGSGSGYGTATLAAAGAGSVIGVDISAEAVAEATAVFGEQCRFVTGDVGALAFDSSSFDLVTCFEVIEHVEHQEQVLDELVRVLRPGGVLAISSPNRLVYPAGNPFHTHEFTPAELDELLRARFGHVRLYRQSPWVSSALLTDSESEAVGDSEQLEARVTKVAAVAPGEELFTVALASESQLPEPTSIVVLGDPFELKWWSDQLDDAQGRLEEMTIDWRGRGRALIAAEGELAKVQDHLAQLELSREELHAWSSREIERLQTSAEDFEARLRRAEKTIDDVTRSLSWRVTSPLRYLTQMLRRPR